MAVLVVLPDVCTNIGLQTILHCCSVVMSAGGAWVWKRPFYLGGTSAREIFIPNPGRDKKKVNEESSREDD